MITRTSEKKTFIVKHIARSERTQHDSAACHVRICVVRNDVNSKKLPRLRGIRSLHFVEQKPVDVCVALRGYKRIADRNR